MVDRTSEFPRRSRLAESIANELKDRRIWERVDSARMSGISSSEPVDFSDIDYRSDEQLIADYLREERERQYWANDRR